MSRVLLSLALYIAASAPLASACEYSITPTPPPQRALVAGGEGAFLAVWVEITGPCSSQIVATRFMWPGGVLGESRYALGGADQYARVSLAFGGGKYLAVWSTGSKLVGVLVPAYGSPSEPFEIQSNVGGGLRTAIAWNGRDFFVVWSYGTTLVSRTVSLGGLVSAQRLITPEPERVKELGNTRAYIGDPEVAWDGGQYLLAWRLWIEQTSSIEGFVPRALMARAARLAADGTLLDTKAISIVDYGENIPVYGLRVASSGPSSLIVLDVANRIDVVVLEHGAPPARRTLFEWINNRWTHDLASDVTFDGRSYVIAWRLRDQSPHSWLESAQLSPDGFLESAKRRSIRLASRGDAEEFAPAIGSDTFGDLVFVVAETAPNQVRAIFPSEMSEIAAPSAPRRVTVRWVGKLVEIRWAMEGSADGFIIESATGSWMFVPGAETRVAILTFMPPGVVRVRAYNTGGVSDPSEPAVIESPRRHAARH